MSLPTSPNRMTPSSLRQGDAGWPVFALQIGLNDLGHDCSADGEFGPKTNTAVKAFQSEEGLETDGIAGPATQSHITRLIDKRTHETYSRLPTGLLRGFALTESGERLGATNWNIAGGVDCGVVQIRCSGPPFNGTALRTAYDPTTSMRRVAVTFLGWVDTLRQADYSSRQPIEWAMRCAALSWNWPWAAQHFATRGKLPNPSLDATWAVIGGRRIKFPDGTPVMTYDDWARFYALGGRHGEGMVTRFVTDWNLG